MKILVDIVLYFLAFVSVIGMILVIVTVCFSLKDFFDFDDYTS